MKLDVNKILDTSNIAEGEVFKSYRQLCAALNQPILAGDSKIRQLKYFQRYFTYIRDKNKYIITEVFNKPLAPTRVIKTKYYEMNNLMDQLLINDLLSKPNNTWVYNSTNDLFQVLGFYKTNVNLKMINLTSEEFGTFTMKYYVSAFCRCMNTIFHKQLRDLLSSLQRRGLIEVYRKYTGVVKVADKPNRYYNLSLEKSKTIDSIYNKIASQSGQNIICSNSKYQAFLNECTRVINTQLEYTFDYYLISYQIKLNSNYDYTSYNLSHSLKGQKQIVANHIASLIYNKTLVCIDYYSSYNGIQNYHKAQEQLIQKYISESYVAPKITNIFSFTLSTPHTERHLIL